MQEQRRACKAIGPRLLACHDLHGNYHSDALPQGNEDADYYRLTQWSSIDVFVYFSHALVTIPPPGWINAAHTNGVPVRHRLCKRASCTDKFTGLTKTACARLHVLTCNQHAEHVYNVLRICVNTTRLHMQL